MAEPFFTPFPLSSSISPPSPPLRRSPLNPMIDLERNATSNSSNSDLPARRVHGRQSSSSNLDSNSLGVLTGAVGGNYSPYPRLSVGNARDSMASSDPMDSNTALDDTSRYSRRNSSYADIRRSYSSEKKLTLVDSSLLWNKDTKEADDYLHNPDAELDKIIDGQFASRYSTRGILNVFWLLVVVGGLIGVFMIFPVTTFTHGGFFQSNGASQVSSLNFGWNIGGINSSGQVPSIPNLPGLIDATTPQSAYARTGFDNEKYNLVFSDEFNTDGRSFHAGDDPFWEASDLHYWATQDYEYYDPDAITTKDGKLLITLSEEPINGFSFRSGFLSSWNKLCFTGGYIEVSLSLPGSSSVSGFWPGAWTMGNLGRPGYGATNFGVWPYSYSACDVGTLPNQTMPDGMTPAAAKDSGSKDYGGELSWLPGQKLSACTCPGEDHPGPNVKVGRGSPEIDIIEAQVDSRLIGSASQSMQVAPIDAGYNWKNTTPNMQIFDSSITFQNQWHGAVNQESMSVITLTGTTAYGGVSYNKFGFEYDPGADGRITWAFGDVPSWQLNAAAIGPNALAEISQRLIPVEPMAINLNLAISKAFQEPEWTKLVFPATLYIDYVRVYQKGKPNVGCNPKDYPTSDYINRHLVVYNNPNRTQWLQEPGYTWPKNSMAAGGCK